MINCNENKSENEIQIIFNRPTRRQGHKYAKQNVYR